VGGAETRPANKFRRLLNRFCAPDGFVSDRGVPPRAFEPIKKILRTGGRAGRGGGVKISATGGRASEL